MPSSPLTTPSWQGISRRRTALYLVFSVVLGIVTALLVSYWLTETARQRLPSGRVVVAAMDIPAGMTIREEMVRSEDVPLAIIPEGRLSFPSDAVGRVAQVRMAKSEVVIADKLIGGKISDAISARLRDKDLRAVYVPISWFVAPLPGVVRGDRVDIVAYAEGIAATEVLVAAAEVIDDPLLSGATARVILAVTVAQANTLLSAHARNIPLMIALRRSGE